MVSVTNFENKVFVFYEFQSKTVGNISKEAIKKEGLTAESRGYPINTTIQYDFILLR